MKRILPLFIVLNLAARLADAAAVVDKPAPDFTGRDIQGQTHKLSDWKGKMVVLEAFNYDCPYSAHHYKSGAMPELQEWAASKGAVWLVVNSVHAKHPSYRAPEAARKEFARLKMKAAAWLDDSDGAIGKAYGLKTTPHMIVISKDGTVAYNGAIDDQASTDNDPRKARNHVREAIEKLLAGQPVAVKTTKPYGCGVKYGD